jgi:hypothetical protein
VLQVQPPLAARQWWAVADLEVLQAIVDLKMLAGSVLIATTQVMRQETKQVRKT